jgi:hypothetical protein
MFKKRPHSISFLAVLRQCSRIHFSTEYHHPEDEGWREYIAISQSGKSWGLERVAGWVRDAGDFPLLHVHYSWRLATVQPAFLPCAARCITSEQHSWRAVGYRGPDNYTLLEFSGKLWAVFVAFGSMKSSRWTWDTQLIPLIQNFILPN